ncbi:MAG: Fur family transcriptional regulator [Candidatus Limnocylindrales bacterium]
MDQTSRIVRAFQDAGYQATPNRRLMAELVAATDGHFSAADLLDRARQRRAKVGRASIFRGLELLTALRVVERLDLPDRSHAYVLCDPDEHHHHLVCSRCGRSVDVADGELARLVEEIGRRHGYRVETHRLELFGLCPACAGAGEAATAPAADVPAADRGGPA